MSGSAPARPWSVVRQDANGNRYRVGHCVTRAEAQDLVERLTGNGTGGADGTGEADGQRYLVECVRPGDADDT